MFPVLIALILACPICVALGVVWGRHLERLESLTPEQTAALLSAAALTPISPEEAVRQGESG